MDHSRVSAGWQYGFGFTMGGMCAFALVALFVNWVSPPARDDTDPAKGRSGMALHIDARTGCQYLGGSWGGLTPRLDSAGKHICEVQ